MPEELTPLEKLQLMVPGYRGYKVKDLIRQDDFLIRQYANQKLEAAINNLSRIEGEIVSQDPFSPLLKRIETIISNIRTLIGTLVSLQGGGSDVYARYKIQTEQLDEIVNNDMQMVDISNQILNLSTSVNNLDAILQNLDNLRNVIMSRNNLFFPKY
ncbi:hypothetical protein DFR86_10915 [Acidianus sulfidivorans JP7]|uniref:Uncharacterized protein n=1 Tax=Acidianus sulfidivorans JP7 TaxID=619593 RepID=A0A2U9IPQ9_9CREN|nr:hypothetical protein [Acidianus sulfidivorans]AWR97995.1 hypothetical protein DFR86_10915 [Acidianus sulfidivorans JP7]